MTLQSDFRGLSDQGLADHLREVSWEASNYESAAGRRAYNELREQALAEQQRRAAANR